MDEKEIDLEVRESNNVKKVFKKKEKKQKLDL